MLTLQHLTSHTRPVLKPLGLPEPTAGTGPEIRQVELCDEEWRLPDDLERSGDLLAIAPGTGALPADLQAALTHLSENGAIALALPSLTLAHETGLASAARAAGLLLVAPTAPCDSQTLRDRVRRRQVAAWEEVAGQNMRLLDLAARLARTEVGPQEVLRTLQIDCSALDVSLVGPDDAPIAAEFKHILAGVRSGRTDTAYLVTQDRYTVMHGLGNAAPHPVLTVTRDSPWPRHLLDLVARAAAVIALLAYPHDQRVVRHQLDRTLEAVRVAILQCLMVGRVASGVRVAEPLWPGVLSAETGRVAVVECAAGEDRAQVAQLLEKAVGPHGLVILCPAVDRHVILLLGIDVPEPSQMLAPIVAEAGRAAGISASGPWSETAQAYTAACDALAAARQASSHLSFHNGDRTFVVRLPSSAVPWAKALLEPLAALPKSKQNQLMESARLVLRVGSKKAGPLDGVDQKTASRRLNEVMEYLGLDRHQLVDRALLDLAFQVEQTVDTDLQITRDPPALHTLLDGAGKAQKYARDRLAELTPAELKVLVTWVKANRSIEDTAILLDRHRNAVSARLYKASAKLMLSLTHPGGAVNDLLWLLVLAGHLPAEFVRDPVSAGAGQAIRPARVPDAQR